MSKLIYLVACTVDRFIARKDGSVDFFLMEGEESGACDRHPPNGRDFANL